MVRSENSQRLSVAKPKKLVRILFGLLILTGISCAVAGMVLTGGVRIQHISMGGVSLSNCFIIWQDKLQVDIGELTIDYEPEIEKTGEKSIDPAKIVHIVQIFSTVVRSITVEKINIGKWQGSVAVNRADDSIYSITALNSDIALHAKLFLHDKSLSVDHFDLSSKKYR